MVAADLTHSTEFEVNSTTLIISCVAEMCPDSGLIANAGNDSLNCCLDSAGFLRLSGEMYGTLSMMLFVEQRSAEIIPVG